MKWTVRQWS